MARWRHALFATLALCATPAIADNGISLVIGRGDGATMSEVAWVRSMLWPDIRIGNWKLSSLFELDLGYWEGNREFGGRDIIEIGATPVIRFSPSMPEARFYIEAGIGAHLLSRTAISDDRKFSTSFQFGDLVGMGVRLGEHRNYELGWRLEHFSNGGISRPNNGVNFWTVRLAYRFMPKGEQ